MPLRAPVVTLKRLCTKVVLENLSDYSTDELRNIPVGLSEDLLHFKDVNWQPTEQHRYRLIRPNMKKLNVACCREDLNSILSVCKSLTSLRCNFVRSELAVPTTQLVDFIPFIQNVVVLELRDSCIRGLDDNFLEAIGDSCLQLEVLILRGLYTGLITDDGIRRLCRSKSGGSKIKHLDLHCDLLTAEGCLTVLKNLKQLKVFEIWGDASYLPGYELIIAFQTLFEDSRILRESTIPTFQLCQLPAVNMQTIKKGTLEFINECCPNVTSVNLNFMRHAEDPLDDELYLVCTECISFETFCKGRNNVWVKVTGLELFYNIEVNLETIAECFPNLRDLKMKFVDFAPISPQPKALCPNAFSKLLSLTLIDNHQYLTQREYMYLLKYSILLEKFNYVDSVLPADYVLMSNPLRHLTHLHVCQYTEISKQCIYELLTRENNLKVLCIASCSVNDLVEVELFIKRNNLNVVFEKCLCLL